MILLFIIAYQILSVKTAPSCVSVSEYDAGGNILPESRQEIIIKLWNV